MVTLWLITPGSTTAIRCAGIRVPRMLVQSVQRDHDAVGNRKRTAREARPTAASNERNLVLVTPADRGNRLIGRLGNDDRQRLFAKRGQPIRLERGLERGVTDKPVLGKNRCEAMEVGQSGWHRLGHAILQRG